MYRTFEQPVIVCEVRDGEKVKVARVRQVELLARALTQTTPGGNPR